MRNHRAGVIAWTVGGFAAMLGIGLTLVEEMRTFPGGPARLAATVLPGAEAFRLMRWPAERLDTLGGYMTYHNIVLIAFFLAVYGSVQGARTIRGAEERGSAEVLLATGWRRWALVRDRTLGFAVGLAVIALGLALGTEWALRAGDASNGTGSLVTMTATALCGLVGYGLALLVSQLTRSSRVASGISVTVVTALYLINNVADELGPMAWLRYLTPFHYSNLSRALVPGYGFDVFGMAMLLGFALVPLALGTWAFERRDYAAPLWHRGATEPEQTAARARVQRPALTAVWRMSLLRGRIGLLVWTVTPAAFAWLYMSLAPSFMEAWKSFSFTNAITGGGGASSPEQLYNAFASELVAPVLAAYVITQAAGWVADLEQGRVEVIVASGVSMTRLLAGRLLALLVSMTVITAVSLTCIAISGSLAHNQIELTSLVRAGACGVLFGLALAGPCALLVAWLRSGLAVVVAAVYVGAAYLVTLIAPVFDWPAWTERPSVFWAFAHPYLRWPPWGGFLVLVVGAVGGALAAAWVSQRRPKVA